MSANLDNTLRRHHQRARVVRQETFKIGLSEARVFHATQDIFKPLSGGRLVMNAHLVNTHKPLHHSVPIATQAVTLKLQLAVVALTMVTMAIVFGVSLLTVSPHRRARSVPQATSSRQSESRLVFLVPWGTSA